MKRLSYVAVMLAFALAAVMAMSNFASAGDGQPQTGAIVVAAVTAGACSASGAFTPAAACKPGARAAGRQLLAAVSCGSNQWCCKHDIGGTGACTKCCSK